MPIWIWLNFEVIFNNNKARILLLVVVIRLIETQSIFIARREIEIEPGTGVF